jgi:serine/threonine protein kinase
VKIGQEKIDGVSACPSLAHLSEFLTGKLDQHHSKLVARHLDSCPSCLDRLTGLETELDPLIAALRRVGSPVEPEKQSCDADSKIERLIGQLIQLQPPCISRISTAKQLLDETRKDNSPDIGATAFAPTSIEAGARIGPYLVEGKLSHGGMGVIYKAIHTRLDRPVALKLMHVERMGKEWAWRRFEREMLAIGKLKHPNIVAASDAGKQDGYHFLAMELLEGVDLGTLARKLDPRTNIANICEMARQVALGLGFIHKNGVVHRDIKPSNLMLCLKDSRMSDLSSPVSAHEVATLKILDLGLARVEMEPNSEPMTASNQLMGTVDYMSPEQCLDSRKVDGRSDLYSLGATLYRLFAKRGPLSGNGNRTQGQKLRALLVEQVHSVQVRCPDLPEELVRLVDKLLERDPETRFQTAREVAKALEPYCLGNNLDSLLLENMSDIALENEFIGPLGNLKTRTDHLVPASRTLATDAGEERTRSMSVVWMWVAALFCLVALSVVFWLKTDGGYLRVEAEPGINVTLDVIKDGKRFDTVQISSADNSYWYRSGKYELRFAGNAGDDFNLSGSDVTLVRGGKSIVSISKVTNAQRKAELEAKDNVTEKMSPAAKPEPPETEVTQSGPVNRRKIAKWIIENGGDLGTDVGLIQTVADIPVEPFEIHRIAMRDATDETAEKVSEFIQRLKKCDQLYLSGGRTRKLTDKALPYLGNAQDLKWLTIESASVSDEGIEQMQVMPSVEYLGLNDLYVTQKSLTLVVSKFPNVSNLNLFSTSLNGGDLKALRQMQQLKTLDLITPKLSSELVAPLLATKLNTVMIRGVNQMELEAVNTLAGIPGLVDFGVQNCKFGDAELDALNKADKLKFLRLGGSKISVEGLRKFAKERENVIIFLEDRNSPLRVLSELENVKVDNR